MQYIFFGFILSLWLVVFKGVQVIKVVSWKLENLGSETFPVINILYDLGIAI